MPRRFRGEPPTRFAELLMNYMRAHQPWPLDQRELATQIGISPSAVHGWLVQGKLPRNLGEIAPKISGATGIPQVEIYAACGYYLSGQPAPESPPRIVEVDRFGELIANLYHQPRLTDEQKWAAIKIAFERYSGLDRPREWIEAEHDVTVAPTEPSLPAISSPSPPDRPRTNTDTNPTHAAVDEPARTDGIVK